ncbi:N-acetylmuramate alpha-1-phosphate uridylyltransferase MurU [Glaciimonas immobilis]|uniref:MurNAc alpha-1-phosphate uridylyltransferase n=1 Tax=Glaciimonas immobilis TaxID=728004 RepID=A0A840RUF6_9BURK|nr:nucleotidyltransferase family protein [Glaciimonas immobilis]KAF3997612.1 nucleotidyltransferase family protein [Glaciimonas immobilis]MBB5200688.1 MurNAc alpha-1-phosphate uridylyltransferase [Glaciimonas immobilis]
MKAMIFSAGRGERMRPLTDTTPKPLLKVRGRPLIVWHIVNLVRAGITDIIINHAHLGQLIEDTLGDGSKFGAKITYSAEGTALETAGGVAKVRHLLGEAPFIAISADIYCPFFNFEQVKTTLEDNDLWGVPHPIETRDVGWIYLVKNPAHHPDGDFAVHSFSVSNEGEPRFTYSGIGVFRPMIFDSIAPGEFGKLAPILRDYADRGQLGGEVYRGDWTDVGTVARLEQLNAPM